MEFSLGFELQKLLGCVKEEPTDKPKEKYSCPKCQKTFISEVSLSKHKLFVHAITKTKETKFKCKLCSNVYAHSKGLQRHFKVKHEGYKYKCSLCGKQYATPIRPKWTCRLCTQETCLWLFTLSQKAAIQKKFDDPYSSSSRCARTFYM